MSLPSELLPTTCDIYRGNPPSGPAAATNVPCQLVGDYACGSKVPGTSMKGWTSYLLLDGSVDIRDGYSGGGTWNLSSADTVNVPSGSTAAYVVILVEVLGKGTPRESKRVYLDRPSGSIGFTP